MEKKAKKPYDLIQDLIGEEFSGKGNLAIDGETILREAFSSQSQERSKDFTRTEGH